MAKTPLSVKLTQEAITGILQKRFEGIAVEFDPYRRGRKLQGILAWDGFEGMAQLDRQELVRETLRSHLTDEQEHLTGLLLTVTPRELMVMREAA